MPRPINNIFHVAVPTAFYSDERLNTAQTLEHIQSLYTRGVKAVLVCGSTGEQHSLSLHEKIQLLAAIQESALPEDLEIIFGLASIRLIEAKQLATELNTATKISAVLIGYPPYIKPSQHEAIGYTNILINILTHKNIILYNNPARTGFDLSTHSVIELIHNPQISGIKEAGALTKVPELLVKAPRPIDLYCGGELLLKEQVKVGFNRFSSIIGNIYPMEINHYVNNLLNNRVSEIEEKQIMTLLKQVYTESTLKTIKDLITQHTNINMGTCRAPLGIG